MATKVRKSNSAGNKHRSSQDLEGSDLDPLSSNGNSTSLGSRTTATEASDSDKDDGYVSWDSWLGIAGLNNAVSELTANAKQKISNLAVPELDMKGFIDKNILPLYQDVVEARSIWNVWERDQPMLEKPGLPLEAFVMVKSLDSKASGKLYKPQKAYEVQSKIQKAYKMTDKYTPCLLKRYSKCNFGHIDSVSATMQRKQQQKKECDMRARMIVANEINCLKLVYDCSYVHTLYEVLIADANPKNSTNGFKETWLKFEYPTFGTLYDVIQHCAGIQARAVAQQKEDLRGLLTIPQASAIGSQVLRALVYLHEHGIVHGNLTSENVVIWPPGICRLTNFECALLQSEIGPRGRDLTEGADVVYKLRTMLDFSTKPRSIYYASPERIIFSQYLSVPFGNKEYLPDESVLSLAESMYAPQSDIYALGILLLEIILQVPPLFSSTEEISYVDKKGKEVERDVERSRIKFMDFISSLRGRTSAKKAGSALHHLFYPHYEIVKHVVDNDREQDIDRFKKNLTVLANCKTDSLIVLMGHRDETLRYETPDPLNPAKIPQFENLHSVSCYFDFIRQCLFLPYDLRPAANVICRHRFVDKAYRELDALEPFIDPMIEDFKNRAGREKMMKQGNLGRGGFKAALTVKPIIQWITEANYRPI